MSTITNDILEFVRDEYLEDDDEIEISAETALISSGIVDSFSMVSLKRYLENKYNIEIPNARATSDAFDTVNNIVSLLKEFNVE